MRSIILVTLILFFVACSSSDDAGHSIIYDDNFVFAELTNGAVNIPRYSGGRLFLLLYNAPAEKFEITDGTLLEKDPSILTVTGIPPQLDTPEAAQAKHVTAENYLNNHNIHYKMRLDESELLRNGRRQFGDVKGQTEKLIAPKIFNIGDSWEWYLITQYDQPKELVATECIGISTYAYFFVETGTNISAEYLEFLKAEYDEKYELMHEYFGKENDVDGNGKVVVVIAELTDEFAGYFSYVDKFSKDYFDDSNEADILYVNSRHILDENQQAYAFEIMVHEFQHMIYFDNAYNRDPYTQSSDLWLNEGLSMLSMYICGYIRADKGDGYILQFLLNSQDSPSLTGWDFSYSHYGYVSLFTRYLYERFGADVIKRIYSADISGYRAVEIATGMDFNELFKDFIITCAISGKGILNDKKYNFETIDFSLYFNWPYTNLIFWSTSAGKQRPVDLKPYSFILVEISGTVDSIVSDNFSGFVYRIKP